VWAKPLSGRNGSAAFLLSGAPTGQSANVTVFWADVGYLYSSNCSVRDLVAQNDLGHFVGGYTALLAKDESMLLKIVPDVFPREL